MLSVVVLTFNSSKTIGRVVASIKPIADRILIVDSYSTDSTEALVRAAGCEFVQHAFVNYAAQRNWAQDYLNGPKDSWVFHLDADEVVDPSTVSHIFKAIQDNHYDAYLVRRHVYFQGHRIRFGHMNPSWHLRLYRYGIGKCEDRIYDQHFITTGRIGRLKGCIHDLQLVSIEHWLGAHNRWSSAEAEEMTRTERKRAGLDGHDKHERLSSSLLVGVRERRRWLKENLYYRLPVLVRPFLFFFYSYILRLGFLDGRIGFVYHFMHVVLFRFLVDAKLCELRMGEGTPLIIENEAF